MYSIILFLFSYSPCLLDLIEIEKKLREAKAERERLLRERVSHLLWETLADTSNHQRHTELDTLVGSLTPTQLQESRQQMFGVLLCMFVALAVGETKKMCMHMRVSENFKKGMEGFRV